MNPCREYKKHDKRALATNHSTAYSLFYGDLERLSTDRTLQSVKKAYDYSVMVSWFLILEYYSMCTGQSIYTTTSIIYNGGKSTRIHRILAGASAMQKVLKTTPSSALEPVANTAFRLFPTLFRTRPSIRSPDPPRKIPSAHAPRKGDLSIVGFKRMHLRPETAPRSYGNACIPACSRVHGIYHLAINQSDHLCIHKNHAYTAIKVRMPELHLYPYRSISLCPAAPKLQRDQTFQSLPTHWNNTRHKRTLLYTGRCDLP